MTDGKCSLFTLAQLTPLHNGVIMWYDCNDTNGKMQEIMPKNVLVSDSVLYYCRPI